VKKQKAVASKEKLRVKRTRPVAKILLQTNPSEHGFPERILFYSTDCLKMGKIPYFTLAIILIRFHPRI